MYLVNVIAMLWSIVHVASAVVPESDNLLASREQSRHRKTPVCAKGAHIVATSSGLQPLHGYGGLLPLVQQIKYSIPGTTNYSIHYPKSNLAPSQLAETARKGTHHLRTYLKWYSNHCPKVPLILLGYSEGALITMNGLCGRSHAGDPYQPPFPEKFAKRIPAVIVWGDPSFVPATSYDKGTCTAGHGENPRANLAGCDAFADTIQSYCLVDDPVCCGGSNPAVHSTYQDIYTSSSLQWTIDSYHQWKKAAPKVHGFSPEGCFQGGVLDGPNFTNSSTSLEFCASACSSYTYFTVENSNLCSCGNTSGNLVAVPSSSCNLACVSNSSETCGGSGYKNLYYNPN